MSDRRKDREDDEFITEAVNEILRWLDPADIYRLREEFLGEPTGFDDLPKADQLLTLLRFLEINFVSLPARIDDVKKRIDSLNQNVDEAAKRINDFEIPSDAGRFVRLTELSTRMENQIQLRASFESVLSACQLTEAYESFLVKHREPYGGKGLYE